MMKNNHPASLGRKEINVETSIKKEIKITLVLTEEEARWLKAMVQNPWGENEPIKSSEMRERFWNALSEVNPV